MSGCSTRLATCNEPYTRQTIRSTYELCEEGSTGSPLALTEEARELHLQPQGNQYHHQLPKDIGKQIL